MNAINIIQIRPVSGSVFLLVVECPTSKKRDAILLTSLFEDMPQSKHVENLEQIISMPDDIQSSEDIVEMTIEIEVRLFDRLNRKCVEWGISVEQLVLAFIRFCSHADNYAVLKEWFSPGNILTELISTSNELECVRAELLEIKQRFGIDKQEAFLEANADISLEEFAAMLHGRDCQPNLTAEELLLAKKRGFVVVYGDSDDRVEFEGAIREEGHTDPLLRNCPAGVLVLSEDGELLDDDSELYAEYVRENRNIITVFYCEKDGLNWAFESTISHETFLTYDGGYDEECADFDDGFARCMVFELSALKVLK